MLKFKEENRLKNKLKESRLIKENGENILTNL